MGVELRLLGPIEAVGPAGPAVLSSARQRALVGLLALRPGLPVTAPRLVQALWGMDPPRTAVRTLQSHLTRAKQALAACGLPGLLTNGRVGYALAAGPESVDACRFEALVAAARAESAAGHVAEAVAGLRTGLGLWRGEALADAELHGWAAAEVARLHKVRLAALGDLWDGELRLGGHADAVPELERLLVADPGEERLVGLLMLARYRCGRHPEALTGYQRLRAHLADTLGVDPSPELQRLHTAILRRDPSLDPPDAPGQVPAQLPSRPGHFTGRPAELALLDAALPPDGPRPGHTGRPAPGTPDQGTSVGTPLVLVSGPAGMGKTALVVEWTQRVADRFADGQIFCDLLGHDESTALTPDEVLGHALRGLGVPAGRVPTSPADQLGLYRSLLRDRGVLLVCDNVGSAEQILPLVPPGPGSLLVATSRHQLPTLDVGYAVRRVELDALSPAESLTLLERVLGPARVAAEPDAAGQLVEACDRMPLALRIAAAKLTSRPRLAIGDLVAELATGNRLDALSVPGDSRSIRAVFASAYHALTPGAAAAFRLAGLHPGPTFAVPLVAAVTGTPVTAARLVTEELAAAHLVSEVASGRFRFHDLIRWYARECAGTEESSDARTRAEERLLDWYLSVADAANDTLTPGRDRARVAARHPVPAPPFGPRHAEVLAFLDAERANLSAVSRHAVELGEDTAAWQLAYLLMGFYYSRGHWASMLEICRTGLAAARRLADGGTEGLMRGQVGVACIQLQRFDEALDALRRALPLMVAAGDAWGEGSVRNNTAVALAALRRFDEAVAEYEAALAMHTANGLSRDVAYALNNLGDAHTRMGQTDLALDYLDRALALVRTLGDERLEAVILHGTGAAHLGEGRHRQAMELFDRARGTQRLIGDRRAEVDTLNDTGLAHLGLAEHAEALDLFDQARRLSRAIADPHLEAVAMTNLGLAEFRAGAPDAAEDWYLRALAVRARVPAVFEEAELHRHLGDLAESRSDLATARSHRDTAIRLYEKANATAEAAALVGRPAG
ncbi:AfsR/SARP family transcriptional regulator [Longispora fulva]|uniref:DNA-binding SARP family transcriptional activator/Tfp pilus assembly protein PilF n=2 Tax=Longispora fulva TaxID=619741 RepID=A0A8J7GYG8_9ACTN|nr:BTAD domain-containing putative transcriptional regulator [Longispora fulva]MBG6141614.1 DNA-binding SARP family transcriptional activator/Tfp pilus assembly protein PilF [Longispora fulva]